MGIYDDVVGCSARYKSDGHTCSFDYYYHYYYYYYYYYYY